MNSGKTGVYTADHSLVDYILGITYEIWEEGNVDLIDQYYDQETQVFCLDGILHGAAAMIDGTNAMLAAFPDRLLLADDVIGKGDSHYGYSSHRVLSPMTNAGESMFGPATGKQVRIFNMADCVVEEGVIVKEWLARDNLALVKQLGFDVRKSAELVAANRSEELSHWFESESARLRSGPASDVTANACGIDHDAVLQALWISGDEAILHSAYPHYSVMHRSPIETISGRTDVLAHFAGLRSAFDIDATSIDHVCVQSGGLGVDHVALRWAVCGTHSGDYLGIPASGKPVYIFGVTHRRIVNGGIAVEWTVFDSLGVMAQLI